MVPVSGDGRNTSTDNNNRANNNRNLELKNLKQNFHQQRSWYCFAEPGAVPTPATNQLQITASDDILPLLFLIRHSTHSATQNEPNDSVCRFLSTIDTELVENRFSQPVLLNRPLEQSPWKLHLSNYSPPRFLPCSPVSQRQRWRATIVNQWYGDYPAIVAVFPNPLIRRHELHEAPKATKMLCSKSGVYVSSEFLSGLKGSQSNRVEIATSTVVWTNGAATFCYRRISRRTRVAMLLLSEKPKPWPSSKHALSGASWEKLNYEHRVLQYRINWGSKDSPGGHWWWSN